MDESTHNKTHPNSPGKPDSPETIILCAKRDDPFARTPKALLNDPRLSGLSKWILAYITSKPAGWRVRVTDICNHCTDGPAAIRSRLKELRAAGYMELVKVRTSRQRFKEWVWKASDSPIFAGNSPDSDFPQVEDRHHSKNKHKVDGNVSNKLVSSDSAPFREEIHPAWCNCFECRSQNATD